MRRVRSVRFLFLCIAAGSFSILPAMAQTVPDSIVTQYSRASTPYSDGLDAAETESYFPGSFVAGFAVGLAMPFVAGAAAGGLHEVTRGSEFAGVAGGTVAAITFIWSGSRMIDRSPIRVPERYHSGRDEQDQRDFDAGYTRVIREKRMGQYGFGTVAGIATCLGTVLYFLFQIDLGTT